MLIVVGFSMVKVPRIQTIWQTGPAPLAITLVTFIATLVTPIHIAVALGVLLHILLNVFRSAEAVRLECIVPLEDGGFSEGVLPEQLPSNEIVILQPIGSLFFACVAELEEKLPEVGEAHHSIVIFRLRDRDEVGSTFIRAIERYTRSLRAQENNLMLEGINHQVLEQLERTDLLDLIGEEKIFLGKPRFGAALRQALADAEAWIAQEREATGEE